MSKTSPDETKQYSRRGNAIYDQSIRKLVEADHVGDFVAIDIDSGAWELNPDDYVATEHLLAAHPGARIWLVRIGSEFAYRIGGTRKRA
jgi:hypothetical protein